MDENPKGAEKARNQTNECQLSRGGAVLIAQIPGLHLTWYLEQQS